VVSQEFLGPHLNGGVGTAYTRLAEILNEAGHEVTLLYTNGRFSLTQPIEFWVQYYLDRGMRFVPLPDSSVPLKAIAYNLEIAHRVYEWLKSHDEFDIVHFPECNGHGYYALAGQRQGLILQQTTTIVGLHGSWQWARAASGQLVRQEAELEDDFLDRRSAELADLVWSPSRYMLERVREHDWDLPPDAHARPLVVPASPVVVPAITAARPVREIVFFGRQEVRKGLLVFLAAIDRLAALWQRFDRTDLVVTILGKPTIIESKDSGLIIRERAAAWPFPLRIIADRDPEQALDYLQGEGRLAVIPSLIENYPNTVLECLAHHVPFLASRVGGILEQIAAEDLDRVCFEPQSETLAQRLLEALRWGHAPARLSFDPARNSKDWVRWHEEVHQEFRGRRVAPTAGIDSDSERDPTISVCIIHRRGSAGLREAVASIRNQERPPLEVFIVALGGSLDESGGELEAMEREFNVAGPPWRLLRQDNGSWGAALNRAAAEAKGDFLLFLSAQSLADPRAITTFAAVARHTGADVLTCLIDVDHDGHPPGVHSGPDYRRLFSGANQPLSLLQNTFGDINALFSRSAFLAVQGFGDQFEAESGDWELFVRLMVRGYRMAVIPEALFCDRVLPKDAISSTPVQDKHLRNLSPHLELLPRPYHTLLELVVSQSPARHVVVPEVANSPAGQEVTARPLAPPPLRYRAVDALNLRLKRVRLLHQFAKKSIQGLLRVRCIAAEWILAREASNRIRQESRTHLGQDHTRQDLSLMNRPTVYGIRARARQPVDADS
jgi:glycosyltransferase involved in cell wall biosynthesis